MIAGHDPAADAVAAESAVDLRPRPDAPLDAAGLVVVSGPGDLAELRTIAEQSLGVGTWPSAVDVGGEVGPATLRSTHLSVERPAAVLGLLIAMEGMIEDRSPWRTWRTAVEMLAPAIADLDTLTIEARIIGTDG